MAFKDILLVLITYPKATDASEIQEAVSFAVALDARISALACIVQVRAPSQHLLSDAFVGTLVDQRGRKVLMLPPSFRQPLKRPQRRLGYFRRPLRRRVSRPTLQI